MMIFDAHQKIALNQLGYGRDYLQPVLETRRHELRETTRQIGTATLGLPDAILGRVALVGGAITTLPKHYLPSTLAAVGYGNVREAYQNALNQLDVYNRLCDTTPRLVLIRSRAELDALLAQWIPHTTLRQHQQGLFLTLDGAEPVLEPRQLEEWVERGVRGLGLGAFSRYTDRTKDGKLTPFGEELVEIAAHFGLLLDLANTSPITYRQILDRDFAAVWVSHAALKRFSDVPFALSDSAIRQLAERGGVVALMPTNQALQQGWQKGDPRLPLARYLDAIDAVCQLTGTPNAVAIGTNWDSGFGVGNLPNELDAINDLMQIGAGLHMRGYSPVDIEAILYGNVLNKLKQVLK